MLTDKQKKAIERAAKLALEGETISLFEKDSQSGDSWTYRARWKWHGSNGNSHSQSWMLFSVPKTQTRHVFDELKAETMAIFRKKLKAEPKTEARQLGFEDARYRTRLDKQFERYHAENPHVFELFRRFAFMAKNSGRTKYSARAIYHRMRWHMDIEVKGDDYKLNNNYSSRYARLLIQKFPEFEGFFETRTLRS